jgi:putative flippase GtrA
MAGATAALTVRAIELPASWRAHLRLHPAAAQLVRYALVGGAGTVLNVLLFLLARLWLDAVPANLVAIVLTTLGTTEANRRFTFHAERHALRTLLQNVCTVAFYAFYGAAVLMLLDAVVARPTHLMESGAVAAASVLGGLARFTIMRLWEFAPVHTPHKDRSAPQRSAPANPRRSTEPRAVTTISTSWDAVVTGLANRSTRVDLPLWRLATIDGPSRDRVAPSA